MLAVAVQSAYLNVPMKILVLVAHMSQCLMLPCKGQLEQVLQIFCLSQAVWVIHPYV